MRRRTFLGLILAGPAVAAVGLPVVTVASARPRPVSATVRQLPLSGVAVPPGAGLRRPGTRLLHLSAPTATAPFSLVGVTWEPDRGLELDVQVRTRSAGRWSPWQVLPPQGEHRPDRGPDTVAGLREGTAPVWVGASDGVQVRVDALSAARPRDIRIQLVDPGSSPGDTPTTAPRAAAHADQGQPEIITRAQWGADESIRRGNPSFNTTVRVGFVHHTASSNNYTAAQAAAMVRGIYAYHVKSNGWSDIGYNYLVDRFGRAYEGRFGGLDRHVVGAHTGGFNANSFAVSLLGDFSSVPASDQTLATVATMLAWKLGSAYRDPQAKAELTSAGGGTSRFSAGTKVSFNVVSGHRDAGNTSCPGSTVYSRLASIRAAVQSDLGAGFADPVVNQTAFALGSTGPLTLTARALVGTVWTVTVLNALGQELRSAKGTTPAINFSWDLTTPAGTPVPPGNYAVRLTGANEVDTALTYAVQVVIDTPICRGAPIQRAVCRTQERTARAPRPSP